MLLAPASVAPGCLKVAVGMGANPDLRPRRWNDERANAIERSGVADDPASDVAIDEGAAPRDARGPWFAFRHIAQARRLGGCNAIIDAETYRHNAQLCMGGTAPQERKTA